MNQLSIILFQAEKKAKDLNCVKYLECSALSKLGKYCSKNNSLFLNKNNLGLKGVFDEAIRVALGIYNKPQQTKPNSLCKML